MLRSFFWQVELFSFVRIIVNYMLDGMNFCYLEVIYLYKVVCEEVLSFLKHLLYFLLYNGNALRLLDRDRETMTAV